MLDRVFPKFDVPRFASSQDVDVALGVLSREGSLRLVELREAGVAYGGRFELNDDDGLDAFTGDDSRGPDQLLEAGVAYGGRLELEDAPGLEALAQDDPPWPGQLLAGDGMFGGRFELKDAPDLGALAQDDPPWPGQLRAGDGRFPPKFIPAARVPVARALTSELPAPHPAALLILGPPFEPDVWAPK